MKGIKSGNRNHQTPLWHNLRNNSWSEQKNMYLTNTLQSQNLNFIALLFFYLITGALERSTFSSGDWLKGFLLLGTNYDSAWLYDLRLQRPPTLWARSEGSSVSIVDLHCTWGQIHTTTEILKNHVFHRFFFLSENIANFLATDLHGMQFWYTSLKHRYTIADRLTGIKT